jgi:hypothetical protein
MITDHKELTKICTEITDYHIVDDDRLIGTMYRYHDQDHFYIITSTSIDGRNISLLERRYNINGVNVETEDETAVDVQWFIHHGIHIELITPNQKALLMI